MNFHLSFPIPAFSESLSYEHTAVWMGSCFAENLSEQMEKYKFQTIVNSHGVLYNPASIAVALRRYMNHTPLNESELFFANECWHSWEHHSSFSHPDKHICLTNINEAISKTAMALKKADWLFITFGSAYTYQRNKQLVGNCHKLPQQEFTKQLLTVAEIVNEYNDLIAKLKTINRNLKIVFTISPVRYIRDGIEENTRSKARLLEAVHQLKEQQTTVFYFPAYELMMDDLRDYRFYKTDLLHPNEQAIDYIFEKFRNTIFDEETGILFEKIKEIIVAKNHRPFYKESEAHKKFKTIYLERSKKLQLENEFLNLAEELNYFL
jgi:GSCFA family